MTGTEELLPLDLKYRPRTFDQVVGNELVVKSLQRLVVRRKGIPKRYLFVGGSGMGKTTLARIVARELGCSEADFVELDNASYRGIDGIRNLRQNANFRPIDGKIKAYLMDEVHGLSRDAQNAMLKTLEEGPKHVYWFLATTDPDKLIPTIKTRCTTFEVQPLSRPNVKLLLNRVCKAEGIDIPKGVKSEIARVCQGSARQALVILDQIRDMDPEDQLDAASESAGVEYQVIELCRGLVKREKWDYLRIILKGLNQEPEITRRQIAGYLNSVILNESRPNERVAEISQYFIEPFYGGQLALTLACYAAWKTE